MRFALSLVALLACSCSGTITARVLTPLVPPSGEADLELINDGFAEAHWSPCAQTWFFERDGVRVRDGMRAACNLDTSLPPGKTRIQLRVPATEGTAFVVLSVVMSRQTLPVEAGPIEISAR
ncbi:MAG: hypothetical protein JNM17_06875 [Archangium sp.]|nr:hypothetical protein [Archangium sp.]